MLHICEQHGLFSLSPEEDLSELPEEVRTADLTKYPEHQLEGRLAHYEREYTFERNPLLRTALKTEVERTEIELNRRKMYRRTEADRLFVL